MKIALFGGTGFVGRAVAASLKNANHNFFEVSRNATGHGSFNADISDYDSLDKIKEKAEVAIICSSQLPKTSYKYEDVATFVNVNILGVTNILRWSRERGVRKIIYCSTLSMVPAIQDDETELIDSSSHYLYKITKSAGEHLVIGFCRQHDLNFLVLRISSVYGPGMKKDVVHTIISKIEKHENFVINNSNTSIDFVHVNDVAKTIVACLKTDYHNTIINVASCQQVKLAELVNIIGRLSGRKEIAIEVKSDQALPSKGYSNHKMMHMIKEVVPLEDGLKELLDSINQVLKIGTVKILILGGTKFAGLELFKKLYQNQQFEVHVASRKDPGNHQYYYFINRKNQDDLTRLIGENQFDIIVDFISYSMPDAEKIINAIRNKQNYNPYLITISSTYVYGNPFEVQVDNVYDESSFNPLTFPYSKLDRPEIDYFLGKKSMEAYIANNYENYALIRLPVILGENDYTGKTTYFLDLIKKEKKISFDMEFGVSNFIFSQEVGELLAYIIENRVTGSLNCCLKEKLDQLDILSLYCQFSKRPLSEILDNNSAVVKSPFFYRKDFIINNSKQAGLYNLTTTFEGALNRELKKLADRNFNQSK